MPTLLALFSESILRAINRSATMYLYIHVLYLYMGEITYAILCCKYILNQISIAQSTGALEYIDCFSSEG